MEVGLLVQLSRREQLDRWVDKSYRRLLIKFALERAVAGNYDLFLSVRFKGSSAVTMNSGSRGFTQQRAAI